MEGPILMSNTVVESKWKGKRYKIIKLLGKGGTSRVYMAMDIDSKEYYAMKISKDNISLNREYQLLKSFSSMDFIVKAHDIDDLLIDQQLWHFLLLEYIPGVNIKGYIEKSKLDLLTILSLSLLLLEEIGKIHQLGYIVGDLKLENIMLDSRNKRLKLIDLGGAVKKNSAIKEYTPAYDRAAWRCGERRGEPSYDGFTLTMLIIRLLLNRKLNPLKDRIEDLILELEGLDISPELIVVIKNALFCKDTDIKDYIKEIKKVYPIEEKRRTKKIEEKKSRIINKLFKASTAFFIITWILILSSKIIELIQ
ncbi:protein kinase domain-containing protein [Alkaliphilus serpentinus]|uniref:Protein kinase domain-containing protein n=1 Tax=Alkaliphilus serpentinus TaxID=1482731 RepID=A0A833HRP3_9FIRM|nr:hypothetical protein [Alkaliphilus serpentinus]KAB3533786.1 hypothetical protein F8153_00030 [Alkaliphilus serpentinus]